ncbi:MAG: DUF6279 family lipoprotein [Gammaproteobacteria bacterium]|nr:DUF6279 family lipoprotein [Gammaproteobacteria bacterium]
MALRTAVVSLRVALVASLLCLAACSGTTFVYNRLDTILPWYVDDYVELSGPQEQQLDHTLQPFLRWHRQQELPRYIELLDDIDTSLAQPVTAGELAAIYSDVEVAWLRLEEQSLDWLLELGATLSEEQVQEFLSLLREKQADYEEEYLSRTELEYREQSYESFADGLEDYLGRLTPQQRERLKRASADLERSDSVWLQERAAWVERLAVLLQRQPGWQQRVREMLARRGETLSPRYQQVFEHNLVVIFGAVADVLNSRTEKQGRHLRAELAGLREDLETLIAQGDAVPPKAG